MPAVAAKIALIEGSDDASRIIEYSEPYAVEFTAVGTAPILFHRWSCDSVEAKSKSAKGSKAKKEDDVESYVYRDESMNLCIPGEYFRQAIISAAKFKQDPRSPRKSAMDLFKAGIVVLDELCSLGTKSWDLMDRRRVTIQRNSITRQRPAMSRGWRVRVTLEVLLPEYISPDLLNDTLQSAGRLVGVGDFRPTFGRFQITSFKVLKS